MLKSKLSFLLSILLIPTLSFAQPSFSTSRSTDNRFVYQGIYQCEFDQMVSITPSSYSTVILRWNNEQIEMSPSLTSTGSVRLEDSRGQWLWLQLGHKSMLFNNETQTRVLDDCTHRRQAQFTPPSLHLND